MAHQTDNSLTVRIAASLLPAGASNHGARYGVTGIVPAKIRPPRGDGMRRLRLEETLAAGVWDRTLGLIAAPAGAGKTTLLAQFAAGLGAPAAWYRLEESDGDAALAVAYLEATLREALPGLTGGWLTVEDAVLALERSPARVVLVIDDLHHLEGTPAEGAFEQLLAHRPPTLAILAASRRVPSSGLLSRLQVAGQLLHLGSEDLRFRSWEVERLFSEHYGQPIPPEEAGELARRTEGWAAGLQMFHLGTSGKTAIERRQTLAALGTRRLAREYLARNVLDDLPPTLRRFLVSTCVLSRMSGPLCDALLGTTGSARWLEELERRQVFTSALDSGGYRYHEALRAHLEGVLREELGPELAQNRYRRAGAILEADGLPVDALQAYCRAEDWPSVERVLGVAGDSLATGRGDWIGLLPPTLRAHDPWVLLATARRLRSAGRWLPALTTYRLAEDGFALQAGPEAGLNRAVQERMALALWLEPAQAPADWTGVVRRAVSVDPLTVAATAPAIPGGRGLLADGLASLLAGDLGRARRQLAAAVAAEDASPELAAGALLAQAAAAALAGLAEAKDLAEQASARADQLRLPWLARLGRAVLALTDRPDGRSEAAAARFFCQEQGDAWGASLAGLLEGLGELRAGGTHTTPLEHAAEAFAGLRAYVLEAWCLCARAAILSAAGDVGARSAADHAERQARRVGLRGPWALAYLALARADGASRDELTRWARTLTEDSGFALLRVFEPAETTPDPAAAPPVRVQCFGGFSLVVDRVVVDLGRVKPRPRKLLHLLALHAGAPLHRENLIEALWPGADPRVGTRNLHVAVSVLRQSLQAPPVSGALSIERDGEDYRLAPATTWSVDVAELGDLLERARRCRIDGDQVGAIDALTSALSLYRGELLPEDGPDDWVVRSRERFRSLAVEVASDLAELLLADGDGLAAARACEQGLVADQTRDDLWRSLEEAHELAGNHAAALATHRRYEKVLADLEID